MKILYYIYQICIALPILLVLTILTAIVTIVGSLVGGAHFWGYYPGKIWSQLICLFLLIPVKIRGREKLHGKTSYIFVPNHQGSFDIFLIYGFIGRNFKWMMKKSLRKLPFVGKACESAGHIFVDHSGPKKVLETIQQAKASLKDGVSLVVFPEGARTFTGHMGNSHGSTMSQPQFLRNVQIMGNRQDTSRRFDTFLTDNHRSIVQRTVLKEKDRKSTRLNSSHTDSSRMPSSA